MGARLRARCLGVILLACSQCGLRTPGFVAPRASGRTFHRSAAAPIAGAEWPAAASKAVGGLAAGGNLAQKCQQAWDYFADNVANIPPLPQGAKQEDRKQHVQRLLDAYQDSLKESLNVQIPAAQRLPTEPVRETPFEALMVNVLCDDGLTGMVAVFAEPGSGKSIAVALAAQHVGAERQDDLIWVLQDSLPQRLEEMFLLSDATFMAGPMRMLFDSLQQEGIKLHMIFDNCLDDGDWGFQEKEYLKLLTRAAAENDHQVIFVMQGREGANAIDRLNGDRSKIAPQHQNTEITDYRWSKDLARKYLESPEGEARVKKSMIVQQRFLNSFNPVDLPQPITPDVLECILRESQVPDAAGCWRADGINEYLKSGRQPAPIAEAELQLSVRDLSTSAAQKIISLKLQGVTKGKIRFSTADTPEVIERTICRSVGLADDARFVLLDTDGCGRAVSGQLEEGEYDVVPL